MKTATRNGRPIFSQIRNIETLKPIREGPKSVKHFKVKCTKRSVHLKYNVLYTYLLKKSTSSTAEYAPSTLYTLRFAMCMHSVGLNGFSN